MREVSSYPAQAYDYINANYGLTGLIVAGVGVVVAVVCAMIWFDRARR